MPLPEGLAEFNKRVSNKLMRPFARRAPGFGVLRHQGRRTGARYETPVNVFRDDSRFIVALTYGENVDWLENARASSGNEIVTRGRTIGVGRPYELTTEEGMTAMPAPVRFVLSTLDVTGFVAFPVD